MNRNAGMFTAHVTVNAILHSVTKEFLYTPDAFTGEYHRLYLLAPALPGNMQG